MNQLQAMMAQMNKMKRDLKKALDELGEKDFVVSKNGAVKVTLKGNKILKSVEIDKDAMDEDSKDMVEEAIVLAINEAMEQIETAIGDINEKITGNRAGFNQ